MLSIGGEVRTSVPCGHQSGAMKDTEGWWERERESEKSVLSAQFDDTDFRCADTSSTEDQACEIQSQEFLPGFIL